MNAAQAPQPVPTGPESAAALALEDLARAELGLAVTAAQGASLLRYVALLRRWTRVHNLTAIRSEDEALSHHILDSLAIVAPLDELGYPEPLHVLDVGAGGGLPGIPLAIVRPAWQCTLVDAVEKKCAFLHQVRMELGLANVQVRHARLGVRDNANIPSQDLVVSRAFASLRDFVDCSRGLLRPGGTWAAMKGKYPEQELAELPADIRVLRTVTLRVPRLAEQRHLVLMRPDGAEKP